MTTGSRIQQHLQQALRREGTALAHRHRPETEVCLIPLILDAPLPGNSAMDDSLLTLPTGPGLVVDRLADDLATVAQGSLLLLPPADMKPRYNHSPRSGTRRPWQVLADDDLPSLLAKREESDYLLLVDPRYWPIAGFDFHFVADQARLYRGATHAIALGADGCDARERVEYDPQGRVRCVQRLYNPMSWPATSSAVLFCSVVPARALCNVSRSTLAELRRHLVREGMLTQDLPVMTDVHRMTTSEGILACIQQLLRAALDGPIPDGLQLRTPGVLVGSQCHIDATARLVPPILIQDHVTIAPDATIIGPTVLGFGSSIGGSTVIAQSVILPGSHIPRDVTISGMVGTKDTDAPVTNTASPPTDIRPDSHPQERDWAERDLTLQDLPRQHVLHQALKRLMDVVLSVLGLVLVGPVLVVVAGVVKATSAGPVFFVHRREGRGGREFGCVKFRTMVDGAHSRQRELYARNQVDGPQFKMDNDPRVTRVGAWLRSTNIDELPQLFNVLAGQMSLVGPRPSPFRENQICVPWRRARLSVRPGITGMWQICRDRRSDGDFHQWIFYDLAYVRHFSLWLDLKILWYTVLSKGGRKRVPLGKLVRMSVAEDDKVTTDKVTR